MFIILRERHKELRTKIAALLRYIKSFIYVYIYVQLTIDAFCFTGTSKYSVNSAQRVVRPAFQGIAESECCN